MSGDKSLYDQAKDAVSGAQQKVGETLSSAKDAVTGTVSLLPNTFALLFSTWGLKIPCSCILVLRHVPKVHTGLELVS